MLKHHLGVAATLLLATLAATASAQSVDFEAVALGTQYGTPAGHSPGDTVLNQNGISMSVEKFTWTGGGTAFNSARIEVPPGLVPNTTQGLHTNNINARFDFSGLPAVNAVMFEYSDQGGNENFNVNGTGLQVVANLTSVVSPPGFNVTVTPVGGGKGTVLVQQVGAAPITSVLVGGQEFGIDNVRVRTAAAQAQYVYSVKFVCGVAEGDPAKSIVGPGIYATEINIHNYRPERAQIRKQVLILVESGEGIGREPRYVEVTGTDGIVLPSNTATMDDCQRIAEITGVDTTALTIGFLVLRSTQHINVDAVYTTNGFDQGRSAPSIEIERVEARRL